MLHFHFIRLVRRVIWPFRPIRITDVGVTLLVLDYERNTMSIFNEQIFRANNYFQIFPAVRDFAIVIFHARNPVCASFALKWKSYVKFTSDRAHGSLKQHRSKIIQIMHNGKNSYFSGRNAFHEITGRSIKCGYLNGIQGNTFPKRVPYPMSGIN